MKILGKNVSLLIARDGELVRVALARDCVIEVQCDAQEFTSALSGRGKRFRAGRYGWNTQVETLMEDGEQQASLLEALKGGEVLTLRADTQWYYKGFARVLQGNVIVQRWREQAPLRGAATCSATFMGDGDLDVIAVRNTMPSPRGE